MNYKTWEKQLKKSLHGLPKAEKASATEYYRELYGDKLEAGASEAEILQEFGSPTSCAARILEAAESSPQNSEKQDKAAYKPTGASAFYIVGMVFLSLTIIIPLGAAAFSVLCAFGAATLGCGIGALVGAIYVFVAPFLGEGVAITFVNIGAGFAICGVGILLTLFFGFLTKYAAIGTWKSLKFIYKR